MVHFSYFMLLHVIYLDHGSEGTKWLLDFLILSLKTVPNDTGWTLREFVMVQNDLRHGQSDTVIFIHKPTLNPCKLHGLWQRFTVACRHSPLREPFSGLPSVGVMSRAPLFFVCKYCLKSTSEQTGPDCSRVPTFYSASSWWRCWISPSFTGTPCFRCCTQFLQLSAWERNILYLWSSCHFYSIFAFLMMLSLCSFLSQPSCFCFS